MANVEKLLDDLNLGLQAFAQDEFTFEVEEELPPLTRSERMAFLQDQIPPPTGLLVSGNEQLFLTVWNATAGVTIGVTGTLLRPNGDMVVLNRNVRPTSDRLGTDLLFRLGPG